MKTNGGDATDICAKEMLDEKGRARVRGLHVLEFPLHILEMAIGMPIFMQGRVILLVEVRAAVIELHKASSASPGRSFFAVACNSVRAIFRDVFEMNVPAMPHIPYRRAS
jgi:hypothetical protein